MMRDLRRSKYLPFIIVGLIVIAIIILAFKSASDRFSNNQAESSSDGRFALPSPIASQTLNKNYKFPLKDTSGKEVSKITYTIQTAQLRDQIIVKGQKASAVKGRLFLIFNLKILNDYDKSVQINARDYLRLIVNNSSEKLAPEIHNDPVEVQAISTKYTNVAFPINDTDKNLTLQVGEIDGKKELIKLNLK
jgi:hypothetical protein